MIDKKYIKVRQKFIGNIDGGIFTIIKITKGLEEVFPMRKSHTQQKTTYIYIKDKTTKRISYTNYENFIHLLATPLQK